MSINKIAIVTGANKGLGFAIVEGLCKKYNGTVYLTSRDEKRGKDACEELEKLGFSPVYHQLDVTDGNSISRFVCYLCERNAVVDILINNAGILFLKDTKEPREYQAEQTVFVNFSSLVNFCEEILPLINDGGKIVNISSSSGHLSRIPSEKLRQKFSSPDLSLDTLKDLVNNYLGAVKRSTDIEDGWGESPYVVSKVGVNAYSFILHRRLSNKGIIVNCVHPGYVMSDMTRGGGTVTPKEAAEVPLQLVLEPEGGGLYVWSNGTVVPWDGPDPRGYIDGKIL